MMRALLSFLALVAAATSAFAGFYDTTARDLRGPPGSIIRYEILDASPSGGIAYRMLYRSTGPRGEAIAVSGVAIRPRGKAPPYGREVVAWAHGTTGIARPCAPSLINSGLDDIPALALLMSRGYVVVATDYPGLGTDNQHPYLVGESEGRAILDSVRAARGIADLAATDRFVVWGHSQGGHAALFAGQLAARYAPDLQLMGVAAAAPATHLSVLLERDLNSVAGRILTVMAMSAWSKLYNAPMQDMVAPKELPQVERIASRCIVSLIDQLADLGSQKKLSPNLLTADPAVTKPWADFLEVNRPGKVLAGAPVLIAQGSSDTIVDPEVTDAFVAGLCQRGTPVRFIRYPQGSHHTVVKRSANQTIAWLGERFAGAPVRTPCGQ
ncbi:MAG: alpha/beta fold hydrolase [Bauldia sp.]